MTLQRPAWLLMWLGIPVLIALYFIKPHYVRRQISSNYLWRLSEKYRKKSVFGQRSKSLLMLLIQLLIVLFLGLTAAGCGVRLLGGETEWIFVLDASASMNQSAGNQTLFDIAREKLLQKAAQAPVGGSVTLIAADGVGRVCAEREQDKNRIAQAVKAMTPGWQEDALDGALSLAQAYLSGNPNAEVYLFTDHAVEETENIAVISLDAQPLPNLRLGELTYEEKGSGIIFRHTVLNHGEASEITLGLYLDERLVSAQTVSCADETEVTWLTDAANWETACVRMPIRDALEEDNAVWTVNRVRQAVRVYLAGESYYLRRVLEAFGDGYSVQTETAEELTPTGFDLYVFSEEAPDQLPEDGAVWLMNPATVPAGIPLTFGDKLYGAYLTAPEDGQDGHVSKLLTGLRPERIALRSFQEAFAGEDIAPVLLCGAYPVLLTGELPSGFRYLMALFDLEQTNLPLLTDFVRLTANALADTAPPLLASTSFAVGAPLSLRLPPDAESAALWRENDPDATLLSLEAESVTVSAPGVYRLMVTRKSGETRTYRFSAYVPETESVPANPIPSLSLTRSGLEQSAPSSYDLTRLLAAVLILLLLLEYGVFMYERF